MRPVRTRKILIVISGLTTGGAETMAYRLAAQWLKAGAAVHVICLGNAGPISQRMIEAGIDVSILGMSGLGGLPSSLYSLIRIARRIRPDVIQGWMYHGNVFSVVCAAALGFSKPLCFGVRHSLSNIDVEEPRLQRVIRLNAMLSRFCRVSVFNSTTAIPQHTKVGFPEKKSIVIPNGFDTTEFNPSENDRLSTRKKLGIGDDTLVIGWIGRFHPMKGLRVFFEAASLYLAKAPAKTRFVLAGPGMDSSNPAVEDLFHDGIDRALFHLLGEQSDIPALLNGFDSFTVCSEYGEGFPNVLGEAMSCGLACVATDVGDSSRVLGSDGILVQPSDARSLADAWRVLAGKTPGERCAIGRSARNRIEQKFSIDSVGKQYLELYDSLADETVAR